MTGLRLASGQQIWNAINGQQPAFHDIHLLSIVRANIDFDGGHAPKNPQSHFRRLGIWGAYYDQNSELQLLDCMDFSTKTKPAARIYQIENSGYFAYPGQKASRPDGLMCADQVMQIENKIRRINQIPIGSIDPDILPDIILRRAASILISNTQKNFGITEPEKSLTRVGFVFNTISASESVSEDFVPEAPDCGLRQIPITDIGGLDQSAIDDICLLARHFVQYCFSKHMPIIWPPVGTYNHWPAEFWAFIEPQDTQASIRLHWYTDQGPNPPDPE